MQKITKNGTRDRTENIILGNKQEDIKIKYNTIQNSIKNRIARRQNKKQNRKQITQKTIEHIIEKEKNIE